MRSDSQDRNTLPGSVVVMMATYNGEKYLDEQIASIAAQTVPHINLIVSDDGSSDATLKLLTRWKSQWTKGSFDVKTGPHSGFSENFRSLILKAPIPNVYFAFSDQDDIWHEDKLASAVRWLSHCNGEQPRLYGSRSRLIDENGRAFGYSPLFRHPPSFKNALVQSLAGGNTMVMNQAAFDVLREAARRTDFVSHDWFAYLLISGVGGAVFYSAEPHVLYRQHGDNLVGSNMGWSARLDRLRRAWDEQFARWNEQNLKALESCRSLLADDAIDTLDSFDAARKGPLLKRVSNLWRSGVYRQSFVSQVSLYAACVLGKL